MTDLSKAKPVLKPLVAMIALANAQMAFGCADVVVNAVSDPGNSPDLTTFEEALVETNLCGSITIDESLASETLSWDTTNIVLATKSLTITGPSTGLATIAAGQYQYANVQENASLSLRNLRFVPSPDLTREVSLIQVGTGSGSLNLENTEFEGIDSSDWRGGGGVIKNAGQLMISDSKFSDNSVTGNGGAIHNRGVAEIRNSLFSGNRAGARGGAIESWDADLTIEDSVFENNQTLTDSNSGIAGGAISTAGEFGVGTTTIRRSEFRGNQARNYGGAIYQSTGETLLIEDTVFEDNHVVAASNEFGTGFNAEAHGGAVAVDRSTGVLIRRSSFVNNTANNYGGALYIGRSGRGGTVTVEDSTFDGNQAVISSSESTLGLGGAVYADSPTGDPVSVSLVRSTLSGNTAAGAGAGFYGAGTDLIAEVVSSTMDGNISAYGGGAMHFFNINGTPVSVRHSTITNNQVTGDQTYNAAALYADNSAGIEISHTVIAGNTQAGVGTGNICVSETSVSVQPNLYYSFWDDTTNNDTSCNPPSADASNILNEADPGLGELADNGGYTLTRYPATDSPLRDAGDPNIVDGPVADQRGSARIINGVVDIGAVESGNLSPVASAIDALEVTEGVPFSVDASSAFSDPEGYQLSYAIDGEPEGVVIDETSGVISGSVEVVGDYAVTVKVTDFYGLSADTSFVLTVVSAEGDSSSGGESNSSNDGSDSSPAGDDTVIADSTSSGGGGSFGVVLGLLAPLAIWRRLRRKA
ncbi:choice-of-anchor Q domain-containing protein [Marinobacter sp. M216]|uniref:Choice-of-anchor Q domain-containing protein n=1 Tax=Marinobacter albus TaxID=3030833 RepID=A0ABT7HFJ3_9GAMM|nr:choice-of-anchor Q domain-containing protein [Marinobacter sp. M216]MDK9559139.1 choice-of-anchor Q domain-containing protein [Marinobacter sp. M216]